MPSYLSKFYCQSIDCLKCVFEFCVNSVDTNDRPDIYRVNIPSIISLSSGRYLKRYSDNLDYDDKYCVGRNSTI